LRDLLNNIKAVALGTNTDNDYKKGRLKHFYGFLR